MLPLQTRAMALIMLASGLGAALACNTDRVLTIPTRPLHLVQCPPDQPDCNSPPPPAFDNSRYGVTTWQDLGRNTQMANITYGSNAAWLRISVNWGQLQPDNAAAWDPTYRGMLDNTIASAVSQGRNVVLVLSGTPAWARGCWRNPAQPGVSWGYAHQNFTTDTTPCPADNMAPPRDDMWIWWRAFADSMVQRYNGPTNTVNHWAVWNEPNDTVGFLHPWPGHAAVDSYALLVGYAADAIHRVTGKKLLAPELGSGDTQSVFLDSFLKQRAYQTDIITVHLYTDPTAIMNKMRAFASDPNTSNKDLWLTEFGYDIGDQLHEQTMANFTKFTFQFTQDSLPRWKKSFYFDVTNHPLYAMLPPGWTSPRQLYFCMSAVALGQPAGSPGQGPCY